MREIRRVPLVDVLLGVCGLGVSGLVALSASDYGLTWFVLADVGVHLGLSAMLVIRRMWRRTSFVVSYAFLAMLAAVVWFAPVNLGVSPLVLCAPLSLYVVSRHEPAVWGVSGLLFGVAGTFVSPFRRMPTESGWVIPLMVIVLVATYLWAAGRRRTELAYREQLAAEQRQHAQVTEARVAQVQSDERSRLARELHDVIAHSLTVVQVQAGTGLSLGTPEQMTLALTNVRDASGQALAEIRSLVSTLRDHHDIESEVLGDVSRIWAWAQAARESGVALQVDAPDSEALNCWQQQWPAQTRLTVLRVVQEGLTNVIKHGGEQPSARLMLGEEAGQVVVQVSNDRVLVNPDLTEAGAGFGLVGLRERVHLAGGSLEAGSDPGGFCLRVVLPVGERTGGIQEQS